MRRRSLMNRDSLSNRCWCLLAELPAVPDLSKRQIAVLGEPRDIMTALGTYSGLIHGCDMNNGNT